MNDGKEKLSHYACKSHTARSEKDLFRVCPSKLSKEEMENLYFALLDNNLQQKKIINSQQEQLKVLNTKVQRMTAHKSVTAFNKDCCSSSKAIINEQKESIADLKRANERLSERIRTLNMRLCSAKQFLKRSPQSNSYCSKCYTSTPSFKNLSTSAIYTKRSESNLQTAALSARILDRDRMLNKSIQTASTQVDMSALDGTCQQNKCRTTVDELERKIVNLEQELERTQKEYKERVSKLEAEVNSLRGENARVRAESAGREEKLREKERESMVLLQKMRNIEAQCDDLNAKLIIEKAKVSELETQVRAGDISEQIVKALEVHSKREILLVPNISSASTESKEKLNINSDDSGYTETNRSQVSDKKENQHNDIPKCDKDISQHIAELQTQLDSIKLTMKQQSRSTTSNGVILEDTLLQSNESQKVAGTSSSLSDDLYTRSMKYFERSDQAPSTLRINDNNMVSSEVTEMPNSGRTQNSQIPLPINKDRMPNVQKHSSQTDEVNKLDNNKIIDNSNNVKYKESVVNDVRSKLSTEKDVSKAELRSSCKSVDASPNRRSSLKEKIDSTEEDVDRQNINNAENTDYKNNDNYDNKSGVIQTDFNNKMDESLAINNKVVTKDVATDEEKLSSSQKSVGQSTFVIETKKNRVTTGKEASVRTKEHNLVVKASSSERVRDGRTYSLASPDSTDCEISSLTDLPPEIGDRGLQYTSPGEERAALSDSYEMDCASLSEGELPLSYTVKKLSLAEVEMRDKIAESMGQQSSLYKMEVALQSISEELARCRQLQYQQVTTSSPIRRFSYPYHYTLPLQ